MVVRKRRRPQIGRAFIPVAAGVRDHLHWLRGARWQIYLEALERTKYEDVWRGWTVVSIARRLRLSERQVRRALVELSNLSPTAPRRKYLRVDLRRGRLTNSIEVCNRIQTESPTKHTDLADTSGHECPPMDAKHDISGHLEEPLYDLPDMEGQEFRTRMSTNTGQECPLIISQLADLQQLSSLSEGLKKERREESRQRFDEKGTEQGPRGPVIDSFLSGDKRPDKTPEDSRPPTRAEVKGFLEQLRALPKWRD